MWKVWSTWARKWVKKIHEDLIHKNDIKKVRKNEKNESKGD